MKGEGPHFYVPLLAGVFGLLQAGCYMSEGRSFLMDAGTDRLPDEPGESRCGNGALEPGEECDDGNLEPLDGCDALCRLESCTPEEETCNGLDDDCDGEIDEGGVCGCRDPFTLVVLNRGSVPGPGDAADPTLAWSGSEYGMAWYGGFARIDRGGNLIESRASPAFSGSSAADMVWSASLGLYIFCWSSGADVYCGTQDPAGGEAGQHLVVDREHEGISYNNPRVAWNPVDSELGVVIPQGLYGSQTLHLARIPETWEPAAEAVQVSERTAMHIWHTALAFTGDSYSLVYTGADGSFYLSRFSGSGEKLQPDALIDRLEGFEYLGNILLWNGEAYTMAASDFYNLYFYSFTAGGVLVSHRVTDYDGNTLVYAPVIAAGPITSDGTCTAASPCTAVVWNDLEGPDWDTGPHSVWFSVVNREGQMLGDPILLSGQAIYPWIATDGETWLAAWREGDIWNPDIAFARIGCR
jgi:cysteine-rich repeat protein